MMGSMFVNEKVRDENERHSAVRGVLSRPSNQDPYRYQYGFGNHHVSEAAPGALPRNGTNLPQKSRYGLYPEHLNGTSFISSRDSVSNVWMYRVRPAVAHRQLRAVKTPSRIESCFLPLNANVEFTPLTHTWGPLPSADDKSRATSGLDKCGLGTFVYGLRTLCGHGDPTLKEGVVVHQYSLDKDMDREAFVNQDGDFLLVPHKGTLDIQTELGHLRVCPGDICVIPAGFRFRIKKGPGKGSIDTYDAASGYALEIFGTHFTLPELGPLGANGLAFVRDFEYPVASFDLDPTAAPSMTTSNLLPDWVVTIKLAGKLYAYSQPHTPFDVVAWHGRYAPYKYTLSRFAHLTANTDQLDPTAYTVLTAPSKWPGVSLVDFCVFGEKFAVAPDTLRIPYYHRTMAAELVGIVEGEYAGSVRPLEAGGLSFEQSYMPHGESYEALRRESERKLGAEVVGHGFLGFMFHVSSHMALTKWAMEKHPDIRLEASGFWDNLQGHFSDNLEEANQAIENLRLVDDAALQAEATAFALEAMAKRTASSRGHAECFGN